MFGNTELTHHKEFKALFGATNSIVTTSSTTMHHNWKIDPCLKHMIRVYKNCMFIGRYISCDEQYIGLWGQHKYKQRVTFKKVVDGFLPDDICADAYTYSFTLGTKPRQSVGYIKVCTH